MRRRAPFYASRRGFLKGSAAVAVSLAALPRRGWSQEERQVNVYNWDTYIGPETLDDFRSETGIEVRYDLYADNAELFAKLRGGNPGYDVIFPTNDYVERMIQAGMIQQLDKSQIPNAENIDPRWMDVAHDPGRRYSMPYMWGTIGIGYRKSRFDQAPDSWQVLFDSDEYAGRIALLGAPTDCIMSALKYLGYSLNTTNPDEIREAEQLILRQKPRIKVFAPDNGQDLLLSGEVDATMEYNGDILQVMEEDDDLGYVVPKEGSILWEDAMCIPTGAPHPQNAHAFINFILNAEQHAAIAEFIQYALPNAAARELMPEEYAENPAIFPPPEILDRCEIALYQGPEISRLYNEAWTRIQAA
jgi:spermidine/putrescine transport system substrate-binding protein